MYINICKRSKITDNRKCYCDTMVNDQLQIGWIWKTAFKKVTFKGDLGSSQCCQSCHDQEEDLPD